MMTKREKKKAYIAKAISNCNKTYKCYGPGKIPGKKLANACKSYAGTVAIENAWGLIDQTVVGSGKSGMLFTDEGVYYKDGQFDKGHYLTYAGYAGGTRFPQLNSSYNMMALNQLMKNLATVETESILDTVNERIGEGDETIDKVVETASKAGEVIDKALKVMNALSNLFGN